MVNVSLFSKSEMVEAISVVKEALKVSGSVVVNYEGMIYLPTFVKSLANMGLLSKVTLESGSSLSAA